MSLRKQIGQFISLDDKQRRYLLGAVYELLMARWCFSRHSIERILRELQMRQFSARGPVGKDENFDVNSVSWALAVGSRHVPWRSDCLIQAMAAHRWLRRHGLVSEFYLGVAKRNEVTLIAHAWLKVGDLTVTGGSVSRYNIIARPELAWRQDTESGPESMS